MALECVHIVRNGLAFLGMPALSDPRKVHETHRTLNVEGILLGQGGVLIILPEENHLWSRIKPY